MFFDSLQSRLSTFGSPAQNEADALEGEFENLRNTLTGQIDARDAAKRLACSFLPLVGVVQSRDQQVGRRSRRLRRSHRSQTPGETAVDSMDPMGKNSSAGFGMAAGAIRRLN